MTEPNYRNEATVGRRLCGVLSACVPPRLITGVSRALMFPAARLKSFRGEEMALVLKNPDGTYASKCALCGEVLSHSIFAAGRFITNKSHEFYRFSDAAMHWDCYVKWPQQSRFASLYFQATVNTRELLRGRNWKTLLKSPDAFVGYVFAENEVSVMLRKSGTDIRLHRSRWQTWLNGGWLRECRPELEHEAVSAILPQLQELQLPEPRSS